MTPAENRAATIDTGALYATTRAEFGELVGSLGPAGLETMVPATPEWRVRDVLAHVVGLAADLNAGNFQPVDPDAWTADQVAARRTRTIAELVAEWDREGPVFEDGLRLFGYSMGAHFVADLFNHLQDVRAALVLPTDRDEITVLVSLDFQLESWDEALRDRGPGRVEVVTAGESRSVGDGPVIARVVAEPFEILRACSGRRTAEQIRAFEWTGDREQAIATVNRYPLPERALAD